MIHSDQPEFFLPIVPLLRTFNLDAFSTFQRRTFWLYKGIGMLKLGRMHRQTGEKFVDPTAMPRQMREVSDF